jgi:hypothetical protein
MGNLWLKIKVWTKILLFSALTLYALLFIYFNGHKEVSIWIWFRTEPERSVLLYLLFAFLTGVIGTILVRTAFRTVAQVRDLRSRSRAEKAERRMAEMESKASRLQQWPETAPAMRAETSLALRPRASAPAVQPAPAAEPRAAIPVEAPAPEHNTTASGNESRAV